MQHLCPSESENTFVVKYFIANVITIRLPFVVNIFRAMSREISPLDNSLGLSYFLWSTGNA